MKPVFRSNLFALIVISVYLLGGNFILGPMHLPKYTLIVLAEILFLLIPTIIYFLVTKLSVVDTLRLHKINIESIVIVILISIVSYPIASFAALIPQLYFTSLTTKVLGSFSSMPLLALLGIQALTPAICEEVTMRGIVLSGYKNISIRKAAIMNGLIFGLFHMNPEQFIYAFILGVIFTYIINITGSIFSTMIAHFVFNGGNTFLLWAQTKLLNIKIASTSNSSIKDLAMSMKIATLSFSFIFAVFAAIIVVLLIMLLKKVNSDKRNVDNYCSTGSIYGQNVSENSEMQLLYNNERKAPERVVNVPFIMMVAIYIGYIAFFFSRYTS